MTKSPRARGFTLIELMVAMAIGAVIAAGATSAMVMILRSTVRVEKQAEVDEDAKILLEALLGELQQVGGGSLRPYHSIFMENDCASDTTVGSVTMPACNGSDRLHFLIIEDGAPQCEITGSAGNLLRYSNTSDCCDPTGANAGNLAGRNIVAIRPAGGGWEARHCHNQTQNPNAGGGGNCRCNFPPGQSQYNPPNPDNDPLIGGTMTIGRSASIYLDTATHTLKMLTDRGDDGDLEEYELAPDVYSFQVELGFDTDGDGNVDQWATAYDVAGSMRSQLRMIRIGLIVGTSVPSRERAQYEQVMGGAAVYVGPDDGILLRTVVGSTSLRNLFLFY